MPQVSRKKRRAVIHDGTQNLDTLPIMLPKWVAPVEPSAEPSTEPLFVFQMRPRCRTNNHRHLDRIKRFCANAKSTVNRKFLMLQYSSDPLQQQQLSAEVVREIDTILTRQQMQLFPTAVDEHLQQVEEARKEEEDARSFTATWNFSHIASKVIAARRQLRSDRSSRRLSSSKSLTSLAPQEGPDRLRHSQESLNADVELESTASVLSRAQELATKCMQSIVTVASSLSEDTLPSYPGADLSSAATVLGFELKTVAGSGKLSHRHPQSPTDTASHQRMFFVLRFDLREFRKVETTSRGWPAEQTVEAALQALATPRKQRGRSTDAMTSSEAEVLPAPSNDLAGVSLLRDRAKEVLAATDRDLLRKARRRIRLESLRSLTVKRSLTALSAFHTALCQLLASVDIDPPPFPDTFLFGAVEEAALSHQSQLRTPTQRPVGGTGSGGIQRLWSRWFSDATVPSTPPTTPSAVATVLATEPVSLRTPSAVEEFPSPIPSTPSSENFKDVCDQLQNYLTDVLALYEHVDEMLATLPADGDDDAPETVRAIAMVAVTTATDTGALRGRAASSDVQLSSDASSTAKAARASPPSLQPTDCLPRSRESKSTSDLPAVAEAMLADASASREPLASPRQPPLSKLSRAAAALSQLLRELLIATDVSEAQIGAFILRTTDEKSARNKGGSPAPQVAAGRTFWATAVPPAALTVHFSGGSFGNAPTRGSHSRNETGDPSDVGVDAELWSDNDSVADSEAPEARYRPIGTADSRRGHQNLLKSYDEADLLRVQLSRCLGCGESLSSSLFGLGKNYAMCHFFGALFCLRWCHGGDSRPIPMRVLHQWDCRPRKVCKLAAVFIDRVRDLPVVRVREANPLLLEGVPKLKRTLAVQQVLRSGMLPRALWADAETLLGLITELLPRRSHLVLADGLFALDDLLAIESERMRHLLQVLTEALLQLHQKGASEEQTAAAVVLVLTANSSDRDRSSLPTAL